MPVVHEKWPIIEIVNLSRGGESRNVVRFYGNGIATREEWERFKSEMDRNYSDKEITDFIDEYNSPEEQEKRTSKAYEEARDFARKPREKRVVPPGYFYLVSITGATPERIIKIGTASDMAGRMKTYQNTYGSNAALIGSWKIEGHREFEKKVQDRFSQKALTTGIDFFYLSDVEIETIKEMISEAAYGKA